MNLELFNKLTSTIKENVAITKFMKELKNFLENNNTERNEISILEKIQNDTKLTIRYRDKMHIERSNILEKYASQTKDKGTMYYIYGKSNNYLISICKKGKSHIVIEADENELPNDAGVDSILRIKNGKYVLDKEITELVQKEMKERFNVLLEEQNNEMKAYRVEGHLYELVENSGDRVWLLDKNNPKKDNKISFEAFDEFEFPNEFLNIAKTGDIFKYQNGKYEIYDKTIVNNK